MPLFNQLASAEQISGTLRALEAHGMKSIVVDTGDEARAGTGQPHHGARNLFGMAAPSEVTAGDIRHWTPRRSPRRLESQATEPL